jgi:phosphate transport system protein
MHLHRETEKLKKMLLTMSAQVEDALQRSIDAFLDRDREKAQDVIDDDVRIDIMELEVEEEALKILALYQPVAEDLRVITSVLKINNDLERLGDYASNIAKRAVFLADHAPIVIPPELGEMYRAATRMVRKSIDCLVQLDANAAAGVRDMDAEVDNYRQVIVDRVIRMMADQPSLVPEALQIFSVSIYLERMGDQATSIAEDVVYMVKGENIHHRRKVERMKERLQRRPAPPE